MPEIESTIDEYPKLLFFDTFSHGSTQELNLDLVQFTNPVYVSEIRIIPLGARVQADFPGGVRLGATNPSEFSVEFFVNDLSTPGASTFQNLGVLEYNQNGPIQHICKNKEIPTDGLILRGWYTTITLAVYGFITKSRPPQSNLVSHNSLPSSETPPSRVISEHKTAEWVQQHAHVYYKEEIPYDLKDLPFEKENVEWTGDNLENKKINWETDEPEKEILQLTEENVALLKTKKTDNDLKSRRRSSVDNDLSTNKDHPKHESKKTKLDKSSSSKKSKSTKKHDTSEDTELFDDNNELDFETTEESKPTLSITNQQDTLSDKNQSPKSVAKEITCNIPLGPSSLAPEDVELISEEEISETEDVDSPSISCMHVMDEVNDLPNETLTPSAHEDSLDMDQFEPILSGSSDIESEEDIDFQEIEFDQSDLADDPSKIFNPFLFEVQPLLSLKNPAIANYEWELQQFQVFEQPNEATDKLKKIESLLKNIELINLEDNADDFVVNLENLTPLLESGLIACDNQEDIFSRLTNILKIGLDFENAYNQPKPVFKVRHLKAGLQLAETLCRFGETLNFELINRLNLQNKLLDLYEKEYLALSMKLTILRVLDFSTNYGSGVKHFVTLENEENGYRRCLKIFRNTHLARVRYSLTNLFRKIHLYEALEDLHVLTSNTTINNNSNNATSKDIDTIIMYLEDILRYIREASYLISQPIRFLPISPRFEYSSDDNDSYFAVFSYFRQFNFLDILLSAITIAEYSSNPTLISCILEILILLLNTENGLLYLASEPNTINKILKIMCNGDDSYSLSPQLGLHLAHRLYIINLVDNFQYKWQTEQMTDIDNTQLLEILSSLFYLTFTTLGKQSTTYVLSKGNLIKPLLKALQLSRSSGRERRKSPGKAYICDLIWMIIKCSDYVPFLERHKTDLIDLASWQADSSNSSWLNPIRSDTCFMYHDISDLCDYLKKHTEKAATYPGELVTTLRILHYLAVPPSGRTVDEDELIELKYKYVLIQLFSHEGLTYLTTILNKIASNYERPHLHTYTLAGKEGVALMSVILPTVQLIRALLEYVIQCRDIEFKDLTAISPLLKTYYLMYSITPTSAVHVDATETNKEIIETLLSYTQAVALEPIHDSRSLNKSLWTCMVSEVLKFSLSAPKVFVPSLCLLSELLPLPLPIQTKYPLSEVEISSAVNSRKLWCAHLLPLDSMLQELISTLFWSSYQPLLQLLKRVCVQLADLGPPTALVVSRSIISGLYSEMTVFADRCLSNKCTRLLNILACLLTHPPIKMAVVQITSGSNKTEETYSDFWRILLGFLMQPQDNNLNLIQGQECIISIIESLCDIEISLYPPPPSQNITVQMYLSNSLPPKNLFNVLCESLVKHADKATNAFSTISLALRSCITFTEYDYGLNCLKNCLSEHSYMLWNVINKITTEWNKENPDTVNCLSNLLEFLKECLPRDTTNMSESDVNFRTLSISPLELSKLLKWNIKQSNDDDKHPLEKTDTFLSEFSSEEDVFSSLKSNLTTLIDMLNSAPANDDSSDDIREEIILNAAEPLLTQFQFRSIFLVGEIEDVRLSVAYWLSASSFEEIEQEAEQVVCNLEEIVKCYVPNLQMENELQKLGHREISQQEHPPKNTNSNEPIEELESKPIPTVLAVKPVKSQNYMRSVSGLYRNDAFRSRVPNSSRAPSLHVDDFIALEKHNQQTAALGYGGRTLGKHQTQDSIVTLRNRNHSFLTDRATHFHSPFRPARGVTNTTWHPLVTTKQLARNTIKSQATVVRHPPTTPLMMRSTDLIRFNLALRWPSPPLRPPPPQLRHHPPPHASIHRHLRPSTTFAPL